MDDAAAEVQAALHAPAVPLDGLARAVEQPGQLQHLVDPPLQRRPPQAVGGAPVAEVVGRAQVLVEGQLLRHHPDARPRRAPVEHHVVPEHVNAARRRRQQARDAADGRRLARPVGPEQPEDAALAGDEADPVHRDEVAVALAQRVDRDQGSSCPVPTSNLAFGFRVGSPRMRPIGSHDGAVWNPGSRRGRFPRAGWFAAALAARPGTRVAGRFPGRRDGYRFAAALDARPGTRTHGRFPGPVRRVWFAAALAAIPVLGFMAVVDRGSAANDGFCGRVVAA